jgi:hypothetical protein
MSDESFAVSMREVIRADQGGSRFIDFEGMLQSDRGIGDHKGGHKKGQHVESPSFYFLRPLFIVPAIMTSQRCRNPDGNRPDHGAVPRDHHRI